MAAQGKQQAETMQIKKQQPSKLTTSKDQIMAQYPDVFEGIGMFSGPPYIIHVDPSVQHKQTSCRPIPVHLKESFKKELDKMLQAGVLKPVTEATPLINSFVLVESKDKSGNLKLHIYFDPTNLNKAIIRKLYHIKMPDDIAHLIVDVCIMTVCDCHRGYWHQKLMQNLDAIDT